MHGEKVFFDVDAEVNIIAKVVNALEDVKGGSLEEQSDAIYQAIRDLRDVTLVEGHIEYLANLTECGACGVRDDRREMVRFIHNTETVYACDEDCQAKVEEFAVMG
jgi:hypothetical protein